ncbi:MAG TPA: carboxypeptidase-like regulatory domain-containing protein [Gemmatimonadaceae bacterium]
MSRAHAQVLRGTVTDSASRRPISSAVLTLLDSSGTVLGRNITNERGEYAIALSSAIQRVRVQRIGYRPRDVRISQEALDAERLDVAMVTIPTFLEPVRVTAMACGRRSDQGSAMALLEQARAGLLSTVVAREKKPASLVLLAYDRAMEGTSDRADRQTVRIDSSYTRVVSFNAVHKAFDFVQQGFMEQREGEQIFFAPDADVLLDDRFADGYCFRVMEPNRSRPNQVGLGFAPAKAGRNRVDIDGALWIDTVARTLRDIEFRYTGLDGRILAFEPGGQLSFAEMPNGLVLIDRWMLRLVATHVETIPGGLGIQRIALSLHETGGELAHARWSDGTVWNATLGKLDLLMLTRDGRVAPGLTVALPGTPYRATSDAAGRLLIADLVPGPYSLVVEDSSLRAIDLTIPTDLWFMSKRDSLAFSVKTRNADQYVVDRCLGERRYRYGGPSDTIRVLARVMDADGEPVGDIRWRLLQNRSPEEDVSRWPVIRDGAFSGSDGIIAACSPMLRPDATIALELMYDGASQMIRRRLTERVNVIRVPFNKL